jgi:hypothetical protein
MTDTIEPTEEERIAAIIAAQNDRFRQSYGADFTVPGQVVTTASVAALPLSAQLAAMTAVMQFDTFTEENDPHGWHDFGAFEIEAEGENHPMFWKIDLYDTDYHYGSEVPENTKVTRRVLTVMLRSDW